MDPLTALSVAGTVVQLVDFGTKLLSSSAELYRSSRGTLEAHQELELITSDLKSVIIKLQESESISSGEVTGPLTKEQDEFQSNFKKICQEAVSISEELLSKLNSLKVQKGKHRKWNSVITAVKIAWSKDEISSLKERLFTLRKSLDSRALHSIGEKVDSSLLQSWSRFDSLDEKTQRILEALTNSSQHLSHDIIEALIVLLRRSQKVNEDEHHKTRQMIRDLCDRSNSSSSRMGAITAQIEMLDVSDKVENQLRNSVNKKILNDLSYESMTNRYEDILQAHPTTFKWIFSDPAKHGHPWDNFGHWLREGTGIYWVNGKAGSGKSTLMKYIYDDGKTKECLREWALRNGSSVIPCHTATFFFWNSGTDIQKSQQGLLQSLLFQVLHEQPELISTVLPVEWAALYARQQNLKYSVSKTSWSLEKLRQAFRRLVEQKQYPLLMCFFIDGMDEYSGDSEDLCTFFKELSLKTSTTKFCLSSRPWVGFQQSFEGFPSVKLQDLTYPDISTYVKDKFSHSPAFARLSGDDPDLSSSITDEILAKAQGVFLWVTVVVRLLLRGIQNRDSNALLRARLRSFPPDLFSLYSTILKQIEPCYLEWASKAFQIKRRTRELEKDPYRQIKAMPQDSPENRVDSINGVSPLTLAQLSVALSEESDLDAITIMSPKELNEKCADTKFHLTARCAGLLELSALRTTAIDSPEHLVVNYMHRTARDFLEREPQWAEIVSYASSSTFSPDVALLQATVILLRQGIFAVASNKCQFTEPEMDNRPISRLAEDVFIYAYFSDEHRPTRALQTKILKILNEIRSASMPEPKHLWENYEDKNWLRDSTLLSLSGFVEDILANEPQQIKSNAAKVLLHSLFSHAHKERSRHMFPRARMVEVLLRLSSSSLDVITIPGHLSRFRMNPCWPSTWHTLPCADIGDGEVSISRLMNAYFALLKPFLTAGIDPTNIEGNVPQSYVLSRKTWEALMKDSLLVHSVYEDISKARRLHMALHTAFGHSVVAHRAALHSGATRTGNADVSGKQPIKKRPYSYLLEKCADRSTSEEDGAEETNSDQNISGRKKTRILDHD